ncbi:ester cyclase [Christiangramia sediminis]|uniref:Nuclear transport factor 2 family protein n=1 Tax=Christiangramia sediminis TaxID=2881336 RepID=A0A9X1LGD1_9FLAO|nr:ester cyclase [Christiangramia sediminis]MCB7479878.1 nuclear transport factor 2 family protein [Christiangramia sediminis]
MKKAILIIFSMFLFISCNKANKEDSTVRYTQDSDEISTLKTVIQNYEKGEWDQYRSHFSDTVKMYYNSREAMNIDAVVAMHQENNAALSSYEFPDAKDEFEMVVTDADETWVNFWGEWQGTIAENDSTVYIPVHITARFEDGKIVEEHLYFDNSGITQALTKLEETRTKAQDSLK